MPPKSKCIDDAVRTEGHGKMKLDPRDRISELPDEILFSILSLLPFKEATVTGVLSTRWASLCSSWLMFTRRLDFDASAWLSGVTEAAKQARITSAWLSGFTEAAEQARIIFGRKLDEVALIIAHWGRIKLVDRVNKILSSHGGHALEVFRVRFDIGKAFQLDMNNWLRFALARGVERLELEFLPYVRTRRSLRDNYCAFPEDISSPPTCNGFKSLKELTLRGINVNDENLRFLLSNCLLLQRLIVDDSHVLTRVEVYGSPLTLRHLEIRRCLSVRSITILDSNLISFSCHVDWFSDIRLHNNPSLEVLELERIQYLGVALHKVSSCISQLEVLKLHLNTEDLVDFSISYHPTLTRLKEIQLAAPFRDGEFPLGFASLLRVAACLEKFTLKIILSDSFENYYAGRKKKRPSPHGPYTHLKVAVVEGYYGGKSAYEAVMYLLYNAPALEELTIDTRRLYHSIRPRLRKDRRNRARRHFEGNVRSQVKLTIL